MDTDDDVSTLDEEEASILETEISQISDTSFALGLNSLESEDTVHSNHDKFQTLEESIKFHVMCAHTEVTHSDKYVVYTIDVERGSDDRPALLVRRYTDFLTLYSALNKSHPALLCRVKFPRRVILGNFEVNLIEKRSKLFEEFLHFVHSKDVLRCSEPFRNFLYRRESRQSSHHLLHSEFEEAIPVLENLYWLLQKLHGDRDHLLRVLLQFLVCLNAVGNYETAYDYALLALPRFDSRKIDGNFLAKEFYVPFLHFCIRLWWVLGRDRTLFEDRLDKVRGEGHRVEGLPDLLESLRDEINLSNVRC